MSELRKRYKSLTRDQEMLLEIVDRLESNNATLSGLALEVTADQINLNTDKLEMGVWSTIPGNSEEYTYYTGIVAGNPSGNKNVQTVVFKTGVTTIATQTYTWDSDDDVLSITAS